MEMYLSIKQVCEKLNVTRTTVNNWLNSGVMSSVKIMGVRRIPESEVLRLVEESKQK